MDTLTFFILADYNSIIGTCHTTPYKPLFSLIYVFYTCTTYGGLCT